MISRSQTLTLKPTLTLQGSAILKRTVVKALAVLKPPPDLTISDWADQNRRLSSEASAEPGQWRTSRAEYQRGIMDAISDPAAETVGSGYRPARGYARLYHEHVTSATEGCDFDFLEPKD